MGEKKHEIRRNCEGEMLYIDARELVDQCIDMGILRGKKGSYVFTYRNASETEPEKFPEGWYFNEYEDVIHELMGDDEGIRCLMYAATEAGQPFRPSLDINLLDSIWLETKPELKFNLEATIHFNRPLNRETDYVVPGGYKILLSNGDTIMFDFGESELYLNDDGSLSFLQRTPDYAMFEDLKKLKQEDLRDFLRFEMFFVYLGEGEESPGLEITGISDASFEVLNDDEWISYAIPKEKIPESAYREQEEKHA